MKPKILKIIDGVVEESPFEIGQKLFPKEDVEYAAACKKNIYKVECNCDSGENIEKTLLALETHLPSISLIDIISCFSNMAINGSLENKRDSNNKVVSIELFAKYEIDLLDAFLAIKLTSIFKGEQVDAKSSDYMLSRNKMIDGSSSIGQRILLDRVSEQDKLKNKITIKL